MFRGIVGVSTHTIYYKSPIFMQHTFTSAYGYKLKRERYNRLYRDALNRYVSGRFDREAKLVDFMAHLKNNIATYADIDVDQGDILQSFMKLPMTTKSDLRYDLDSRSFKGEGAPFIYGNGDGTYSIGHETGLFEFLRVGSHLYEMVVTSVGIARVVVGIENQIAAFQFVQEDLKRFVVYLVVEDDYDDRTDRLFKKRVVRRLGADSDIEYRYVDHIPREKNGKIRFIKNAVADPG